MVSFCCETCNETVTKKKAGAHFGQCHSAVLACIDCSKSFPGRTWADHTSCITEAEKYRHSAGTTKKPQIAPTVKDKQKKPVAETQVKPELKVEQKKSKTDEFKLKGTIKVDKKTTLKKLLRQLRKDNGLDKNNILAHVAVLPSGELTWE